MIDKIKITELLEMMDRNNNPEFPVEEFFEEPLMEAIGEDRHGLEELLRGLNIDDLDTIVGSFDLFYDKWHDDEMLHFLDRLAAKLEAKGKDGTW